MFKLPVVSHVITYKGNKGDFSPIIMQPIELKCHRHLGSQLSKRLLFGELVTGKKFACDTVTPCLIDTHLIQTHRLFNTHTYLGHFDLSFYCPF